MVLTMRKILCFYTVALFLLLVLPKTAPAQAASPGQIDWQVGEELYYKVKYTFLTVGSLYFQVLGEENVRGQKTYHCKMHMKSSSAIPFVNLNDIYESYIDADSVYAHRFRALENQGDYTLYSQYEMDYQSGKIHIIMEKWYQDGRDSVRIKDSTAVLENRLQDGLSLLFYARANARRNAPQDVPVFAFNELKSTMINFTGRTEEVKPRGVKTDGYYLDGKMKFVGIAGVKEDFEGWFSPDGQSVPLHAKMKAFIGSVRINLEWWRNWQGEDLLGPEAIEENEKKVQEYLEKRYDENS